MSSVHETHSTFQYTQRSNSEEERLAKLHRILHSLATRIPRILLKRVEEVFPALYMNVKENSGPESTLASNAECETEEHKYVAKNYTQHVKSEPENRNEESRIFDNSRKNSGPGSTLASNAECETEEHKCVAKNYTQHVKSEPENRNEESRIFDNCRKRKRKIQKCKNDRRYSCDFCNKKLTKYYLKLHMQHHTGSLPHTCTVCSRQFPFSSNLRLHYQRVHRMKY